MLHKALLSSPKEFRVSIGTQTYCTASVNKSSAMPGDLVTVTVRSNTGYGNVKVGVSPSVEVAKVNETTFTFVMPFTDVVVSASASALDFRINVSKTGQGTVTVKSLAKYGETVTVTLSPAAGNSLRSISSSDVALSGGGNTRTFVMPARNVTLTVVFEQDYHVVITVGHLNVSPTVKYGYSDGTRPFGSIDRIPYWDNPGVYLTEIGSVFFGAKKTFTRDQILTSVDHGLSAMVVNGKSMQVEGKQFYTSYPPPLVDSSLGGKELRIKFDPPPTGYL